MELQALTNFDTGKTRETIIDVWCFIDIHFSFTGSEACIK